MARSIARAVRGASGMTTIFPPLRRTVRVRWPRSMTELVDVGAEGFRYPQPVDREQRDQGVLIRRAEPGRDE